MSAVLRPATRFEPMTEADLRAVLEIEEAIYAFPWTPGNFRDSLRAGYGCWVYRLVRRAPFERGGPASLHRIRFQAGRRAARLLSGAARSRGRAGPFLGPVSARRERYLEEMGLGPVW